MEVALPLLVVAGGGAAGYMAAASGRGRGGAAGRRVPIERVEAAVATAIGRAQAATVVGLLNSESANDTAEAIKRLSHHFLPPGTKPIKFVVVDKEEAASMDCRRACALPAQIYASAAFIQQGQYRARPHLPLPKGVSHWAFIILHEFGHILQYRNLGAYPPVYTQAAEYTRKQEYEADAFAAAFLRRAGFTTMRMPRGPGGGGGGGDSSS